MRDLLALTAIKAAWAEFIGSFWAGYDAARARAQPALAPGNPFAGLSEDEIKAMIEPAMRAAYVEGVAVGVTAERARVTEILQAPGAAHFLEIAVDLALGQATGEQAIQVLARAEADAATRAGIIKSNMVESANAPTRH
jgi:hypothetical protein